MGCRLKASRLCFQSRPAALPAISKSTELQPSGQPVSRLKSSPPGLSRASKLQRIWLSYDSIPAPFQDQFIIYLLTPTSPRSTLQPSSTLVWHFQPIRSQSKGAANAPPVSARAIPAKLHTNLPSQPAQYLTQLPLTEVSTLLDQKIPGNHAWH